MEIKPKSYEYINTANAINNVHTPATIINIFNNALSLRENKKIIIVQGIYESKGIKNYGGHYYDQLKDETSNQLLTIMIPEILRQDLKEGYTYKMKGYLNKKVLDDSVIQLTFGVIDVLSNEGKRMSPDALKVFDIRKKKSDKGYKNLDEILRKKLYKNEFVNIALIYGNEAIIDKDIYRALEETINCYNITEHRVNLTSKDGIIEKISEVNNEAYDVIVISRGGGSGLDIFNDVDIAEAALDIKPIFVTAIGHAADNTLLEDIADKKFDTPTALGNYLKEIANNIINDLTNKKEEKQRFEKIESDLKCKLIEETNEYEGKITGQARDFHSQLNRARKYEIILLLIGIAIGIVLTKLLK